MYCNYKLIPSASLLHRELEYILTPDEYIRTLHRKNNVQSIISELPKALRESLSFSASKNVQSVLLSLYQKLMKAEWIVISVSVRKTKLTETKLAQYPHLKKHIDRVKDTQPSQFIKANFKSVAEVTVLQRNLSFTPVEPSPDHKIVVEFSGQWPNNAASLLLSKAGEQKEKTTKPRADDQNIHRSLATFKNLELTPRTLYLTVPMSGSPVPLKLLLARGVEPVPKETEMGEWDNVLVPIRVLAYLNDEKNKAQAADLKGGYAYLFWKNRLWREFYIHDNGYYQDIDVEYHRTLFSEEQVKAEPKTLHREPDGLPLAQFWVPYKILGEKQQGDSGLNICFSPKQKSFQQISQLESDSSKLAKESTPLDELSIYSDAQLFNIQEHTSDIDSALIHKVTEEDMPWLTDKEAIVRGFDQTNTAIAYVDGHNEGLLVRLEVASGNYTCDDIFHLYAVMEDVQSDWAENEVMEVNLEGEYVQTLIQGFPKNGVFNLFIVNPEDSDSAVQVFKELTYKQLTEEKPAFPPVKVVEAHQASSDDIDSEKIHKNYMDMWRSEVEL